MCLFLVIITMVSYASFTQTTSKYRRSDDMYAFPASFVFKEETLSSNYGVSLLEIVTNLNSWKVKWIS